jgi:mannose-6-phosphate isomerase-like protein (cupin superfamily)
MSLHPVTSHSESVATLDVMGFVSRVLLDGKQTHGAFSLAEVILSPEEAIGPHVHRREEETFHVLEGELEVTCGSHTTSLRAGDTFFAPRGLPHSARAIGESAVRLLVIITPAGFERFFRDVDELAARGDASPEQIKALLREQYDCEFLSPAG